MKIIESTYDMIQWKKEKRQFSPGKTIGFVPTMGALHAGHLEIVKTSKAENQFTVVSIFVNPTQFNDPKDFEKYPKTLEADIKILEALNPDVVFVPKAEEIYRDQSQFSLTEIHLKEQFAEARRLGHFEGVMTVVMKLINIVGCHRIYLGEKDFQQLEIIQRMVQAFFMPVEVRPVPTVRDEEGLALSSRNQRLSEDGIRRARYFAQQLKTAKTEQDLKEALAKEDITLDYVADYKGRRLAAVFIEGVRLIDNVA
ncbi:MAG: pantoate--beta-alanine ligase, partial [Bdellovibrionales bacterium]|nr:pantoate--beta-alanine ligase [Bdellovibrionales bacterium]